MNTVARKSATMTARKELVMALYELGMSFLKGWGVAKDKVIAFNYFKLAADLVRTKSYVRFYCLSMVNDFMMLTLTFILSIKKG